MKSIPIKKQLIRLIRIRLAFAVVVVCIRGLRNKIFIYFVLVVSLPLHTRFSLQLDIAKF